MLKAIRDKNPEALYSVMNQAGVVVTVLDLDGNMIYYSDNVPSVMTRNESLLGKDVRACHKQATSNQKIDAILADYKQGKGGSHHWNVERDGSKIGVTVTPLRDNGEIVGLLHAAMELA